MKTTIIVCIALMSITASNVNADIGEILRSFVTEVRQDLDDASRQRQLERIGEDWQNGRLEDAGLLDSIGGELAPVPGRPIGSSVDLLYNIYFTQPRADQFRFRRHSNAAIHIVDRNGNTMSSGRLRHCDWHTSDYDLDEERSRGSAHYRRCSGCAVVDDPDVSQRVVATADGALNYASVSGLDSARDGNYTVRAYNNQASVKEDLQGLIEKEIVSIVENWLWRRIEM